LKKKHYILLIIFLSYSFCWAQESNDAGLWTTLNIEKQFKKNTSIFLTEEFRLRENFTQLNLFYTDIGFAIKPAKFLKISFSYRNIQKYIYEDQTFSYRHRLSLDISLRKKWEPFTFAYRNRLQSEVRNVYISEDGYIPEWYSRHKFDIKYDLNKIFRPYISFELRYQIHNPRLVEGDKIWSRNRYAIGLDYKRNDRDTFGIYYLIQREFNLSEPQHLYIIGLEYSITL